MQKHQRAMSDPFDAQEQDDVYDASHSSETKPTTDAAATAPLPTLPRFPVSATRNRNCWSEPQVDMFKVRSKHYFDTRLKVTSGPYMMEARGCDLLLLNSSAKDDDEIVGSGNGNGVSMIQDK